MKQAVALLSEGYLSHVSLDFLINDRRSLKLLSKKHSNY